MQFCLSDTVLEINKTVSSFYCFDYGKEINPQLLQVFDPNEQR